MESLWSEYERQQLWPGQQFEEEHNDVVPRSKLEEIWAWEDYAVGEYVRWLGEVLEPQLIEDGRYGN